MTESTYREIADVARRAAQIIQQRGKATGVYKDDLGRVCAAGALAEASELRLGFEAIIQRCEVAVAAAWPSSLAVWSDLPTTTEADIAKLFLQVADEIEASP